MGFKDLFIQKETDETDELTKEVLSKEIGEDRYSLTGSEELVEEVDISEFNDGVVSIKEIYEKEELSDLSKSIFKVEEIRAVVPAEIASDVRKKTVLGMLGVSGLNIESLLSDANNRILTLEGAKKAFCDSSAETILNSEAQIAELESKIDELKQSINKTKMENEAQTASIDAEINRITEIISFIK